MSLGSLNNVVSSDVYRSDEASNGTSTCTHEENTNEIKLISENQLILQMEKNEISTVWQNNKHFQIPVESIITEKSQELIHILKPKVIPNSVMECKKVCLPYSSDGLEHNDRCAQVPNGIQCNITPTASSKYPLYTDESSRLKSFESWPAKSAGNMTTEKLANTGFYFTGKRDMVQCFDCRLCLKEFCNTDDPFTEHVRFGDECGYMNKLLASTYEDQAKTFKNKLQSKNPEKYRQIQLQSVRQQSGIQSCERPYRTPYEAYSARLDTFSKWPTRLKQTPMQLTEAGFFYTGIDDKVVCFSCGGGLRHWEASDDPWTGHCRWFPACPFAREKKGDDYIHAVQALFYCEQHMPEVVV